MKKIEKLTSKQGARLSEFRDEGLAVGLSTRRANRKAAEEALAEAYKEGGLTPPRIVLWLRSSLEGVVAANILPDILKLGAQVRSQVESQVRSQVESQIGEQVESQVRSQVESQVRSQVGE